MSDREIREASAADLDQLFALYALIVAEGGAFPRKPPADRQSFREVWLDKALVMVACADGHLAGSYYVTPNYGGLASHIANAGYMVHPDRRGRGLGRRLVEHSIAEARRLGFDAMMFNMVFESNPARRLYERLGFEVVGRVPDAVGGEAGLVYWRAL